MTALNTQTHLSPWILGIVLLFPFMAFFSRALSDTVIVLIDLAFLYRSYQNHDWSWARAPWFKLALVIWVYLILIVAPQAEESLRSLVFGFGFIRWPLFAAALAQWLLADLPTRRKFEWTLATLAAFVVADSTYQYFAGQDIFGHLPTDTRLTGPFKKLVPGTFTLRIFFIVLAAVYFGLRFRSDRTRAATVLSLLAVGAGFEFLTGERVAFAVFLFGSIIVFVGLWLSYPSLRRFLSGSAIGLAIFVAIGASTQPKMVERTINSLIAGAANYSQEPGGRIIASAIHIWKDHPLFGIGISNFNQTCTRYLANGQVSECSTHPHNIYIQWLVESGVIGLVLFVALVVSLFITIWRHRIDGMLMLPLLATITLLTTLWPLMGSMSFFNNWIAAVIWMGIGWALAVTQGRPPSIGTGRTK